MLVDRAERRRLSTRARLVDAARRVIGRRGVDAASVAEIASEADVGVGSFYNHFRSKDEVLEVVVADAIETVGRALDHVKNPAADPAAVVAHSMRQVVRMVEGDPVWAWFVVRASQYAPALLASLAPRLERDLRDGVARGRFTVADPALAVVAIGGAVLGVMQARLLGYLGVAADQRLAALVLGLLGVPAAEAARLAAAPLPDLEDHAR